MRPSGTIVPGSLITGEGTQPSLTPMTDVDHEKVRLESIHHHSPPWQSSVQGKILFQCILNTDTRYLFRYIYETNLV